MENGELDNLSRLIGNLSPEKREQLQQWLLESSSAPNPEDTIQHGTAGAGALSFAQQRLWFLAQLQPSLKMRNFV